VQQTRLGVGACTSACHVACFSLTPYALALLKGGQNGEPAIVPGHADRSHLLQYVADKVEDLEMPPLNRREKFPALTREEVGQIRRWIEAGAPWSEPGPISQN
jgi:hypothetical protein